MADYYSHRDPRQKGDQYLDYDTGSNTGWIWAIVVLVALVGLFALGSSGGGDGAAIDGVTPAATDPSSIEAPTAPAAANE